MGREPSKTMTGADSIDRLLANRAALSAAPTQLPSAGAIVEIDLDLLDDNPYQPRQWMDPDKVAELAESIRQRGTRQPDQPILVRPAPGGRFWIIAGHRRRAAKLLLRDQVPPAERDQWKTIAAVVNAAATEEASAFIALEENIQREDLSPVEEGAAYARLLEQFSETTPNKTALARRLGIPEQRVQRMIRLHEAPQFLKDFVLNGVMVDGQGDADKKQRRERRQLSFLPALEFLRLYEHVMKQVDTKNPAKAAAKAEERCSAWVVRALEENWGLRRIEEVCSGLSRGKEPPAASEKTRAMPTGEAEALELRGNRVVVHLDRLRRLTANGKAAVRERLQALLDEQDSLTVSADGNAPAVAPETAPEGAPTG